MTRNFFYLRVFSDGRTADIDIAFPDPDQARDAAAYLTQYFPEMRFEVIPEEKRRDGTFPISG